MSHCERLLEVLSDGQEHPHTELYRLGMMVHSRVSDLRKRGHNITQHVRRVDGRNVSFYRLLGSLPARSQPDDWGRTAGRAGSDRAPARRTSLLSRRDDDEDGTAVTPSTVPSSSPRQLSLELPGSAFKRDIAA